MHADDVDLEPQLATELTHARGLVSAEFVDKMKERLKQDSRARMNSEKLVSTVLTSRECVYLIFILLVGECHCR